MKNTLRVVLPVLVFMLVSCGTTTPSTFNGFWTAALRTPDGTNTFDFSAKFVQGGGGANVAVSGFELDFPGGLNESCFSSQTSEMATFSSTGNSNGVQTGQFAMTISGAQGNVLTVQGNLTSNSTNENVAGEWTLTGAAGCNASGTFMMNPVPVDPV